MAGFISRLFGSSAQAGAVDVTPPDTLWLRQAFFAEGSAAGSTVTVDRALHLDTVFACIRVLSESVGALPMKTYARQKGGGRADMWWTPTANLIGVRPNEDMTSMALWGTATAHLNTWGSAYLGKDFDQAGQIRALWPIKPDMIRVGRLKGRKVFYLRNPETLVEDPTPATADEILHIPGLSIDGLTGLSPIAYARETIGAGLAMEEFVNRFYANSAMPRGVLSVDGDLDEPAAKRLRRQWESIYRGSRNANRIAVLDNSAKFQALNMPMTDLEYVASANLNTQKLARIFRLPPSMVGSDSGSTLKYETVEWEGINFEKYSIRPWCVRIEQALALDNDLFPGTSQGVYPQFQTDDLLRADTLNRYQANAIALGGTSTSVGWMTRAEIREAENLPPETTPPPVTNTTDLATGAIDDMNRLIAEIQAARDAAPTNGGTHRVHA